MQTIRFCLQETIWYLNQLKQNQTKMKKGFALADLILMTVARYGFAHMEIRGNFGDWNSLLG